MPAMTIQTRSPYSRVSTELGLGLAVLLACATTSALAREHMEVPRGFDYSVVPWPAIVKAEVLKVAQATESVPGVIQLRVLKSLGPLKLPQIFHLILPIDTKDKSFKWAAIPEIKEGDRVILPVQRGSLEQSEQPWVTFKNEPPAYDVETDWAYIEKIFGYMEELRNLPDAERVERLEKRLKESDRAALFAMLALYPEKLGPLPKTLIKAAKVMEPEMGSMMMGRCQFATLPNEEFHPDLSTKELIEQHSLGDDLLGHAEGIRRALVAKAQAGDDLAIEYWIEVIKKDPTKFWLHRAAAKALCPNAKIPKVQEAFQQALLNGCISNYGEEDVLAAILNGGESGFSLIVDLLSGKKKMAELEDRKRYVSPSIGSLIEGTERTQDLVGLLSHKDERVRAFGCNALGKLGHTASIERMARMFDDPKETHMVRFWAAAGILQIKPEDAMPFGIKVLNTDDLPEFNWSVGLDHGEMDLKVLLIIHWTEMWGESWLKALQERAAVLLERVLGREEVATVKWADELWRILYRLANEEDKSYLPKISKMLVRLGTELPQRHGEIRAVHNCQALVVRAIGNSEDEECWDRLYEYAQSAPSREVRVARGLVVSRKRLARRFVQYRCKDPEVRPPGLAEQTKASVRSLADEDEQNREKATQDLIRLGKDALPEIRAAVDDPDLERAIRARRVLAILDGPEWRYYLGCALFHSQEPAFAAHALDLLADDHVAIRALGFEALRSLMGKDVAFDPFAPLAERSAAIARWRSAVQKEE